MSQAEVKTAYAVEMRNITKSFGNFKANDDVTLCVKYGEIHGLLGENGAGKSTLMNVLFGLLQPDSGTISINGVPHKMKGTHDAMNLGIQMVHQHFMLAMPYKAWENVILGAEPRKFKFFIDKKKAYEKVNEAAAKCGFKIDPGTIVKTMPIALQQKLEIVRALYHKCDIIILDEPTAVLSENESDELLALLDQLKKDGKAIILITHKLREAIKACDTITVLRHGKVVETVPAKGATPESLASAMVGKPVLFDLPGRKDIDGQPLLEFDNVTTGAQKNDLKEVSFCLKQGEILGVAGVEGNGQRILTKALLGLKPLRTGSISIEGENIAKWSTGKRVKTIAHIVEDRHNQGLINQFSIEDNFLLGRQDEPSFKKGILINQKAVEEASTQAIKDFDVRLNSHAQKAGSLSGGNQQKLLICREFTKNGIKIVIAEHPSRGLDIASTEFVQKSLIKMRNEGMCVILISADLDELLSVSDRVGVMFDGRFVAFGKPNDFTPQELGLYMTGGSLK